MAGIGTSEKALWKMKKPNKKRLKKSKRIFWIVVIRWSCSFSKKVVNVQEMLYRWHWLLLLCCCRWLYLGSCVKVIHREKDTPLFEKINQFIPSFFIRVFVKMRTLLETNKKENLFIILKFYFQLCQVFAKDKRFSHQNKEGLM